MVVCKAGDLGFILFLMTKKMVEWIVQSVREQTVMKGGHTLPLCVLLWFKVTCCERQGLEVKGTRDDSCCDHCFFATTKHTITGLKIITTTIKQKIAWYWVCARTLRWCVPGQVSAEQSRLHPSSHHMDWNCSQEHRNGGMESRDRGMRTVRGKDERCREW